MKINKFLILIFFICIPLHAETNAQIKAITYETTPIAIDFVLKLEEKLNQKITITDLQKQDYRPTENSILLVIGIKALNRTLELGIKEPSIAIYTRRTSFYHSLQAHKHFQLSNAKVPNTQNISAIFPDPNLDAQFKIIRELYKKDSKVAVILSPITLFMKDELIRKADQAELNLQIVETSIDADINQTMNSIGDSKVLLAVPDVLTWNAKTLKNIVLTTYRKDKAIIGFSRNLVTAGASATVFSDVNHIVAQASEYISIFKEKGTLPEPNYSSFYSIAFNESVARSIGIKDIETKLDKEKIGYDRT